MFCLVYSSKEWHVKKTGLSENKYFVTNKFCTNRCFRGFISIHSLKVSIFVIRSCLNTNLRKTCGDAHIQYWIIRRANVEWTRFWRKWRIAYVFLVVRFRCCFYSHNDVLQVAQRNVSIVAHTQHRVRSFVRFHIKQCNIKKRGQ